MSLSSISIMSPLPPAKISKEWTNYEREGWELSPERQRTVRSETTTNCVSKVIFSEEINEGDDNEEESDFLDTLTQSAVQKTSVDEDTITVARSASSTSATGEIDEYDSETDTDMLISMKLY